MIRKRTKKPEGKAKKINKMKSNSKRKFSKGKGS